MKYHLVANCNLTRFNEKVNKLLAKDWKLDGEHKITKYGAGRLYSQALTKDEPEPKPKPTPPTSGGLA